MDSIPQKQCSKCKEWFPATREYFVKDSTKSDGWYSCCKPCQKVRARRITPDGYMWCSNCKHFLPKTIEYFNPYLVNANSRNSGICKKCGCERVKANYIPSTRVKITPEEKKARKKQSDKEYARRNKQRIADYHKDWTENNREHVNKKNRDWSRAHLEYGKQRKAKRRATEANAEGEHTAADVALQYKSQKGLCWWCGKKLGDKWHEDHLIPLNRGGTNWPNNIVCSCAKCNQSRKDKLPSEWSDRLL